MSKGARDTKIRREVVKDGNRERRKTGMFRYTKVGKDTSLHQEVKQTYELPN